MANDTERLLADVAAIKEALASQGIHNAVVDQKLTALIEDVKEMRESASRVFVTAERYSPVERLVFGLVGTVCLGVLAAVVSLVIR